MKRKALLTAMTTVIATVGAAAFLGCAPTESDPDAGRSVPTSPAESGYAFTGRVSSIVQRVNYNGTAILTRDVDPRWVVVIEDVQPVSGSVPAREGGTLAYLIHSPARLFGLVAPADEVVGRTCLFSAQAGADPQRGVALAVTSADDARE